MKEKKNILFTMKINKKEQWLIESLANTYGCNMSQAVLKCLMYCQNWLVTKNQWKPIMTQKEINDRNEWEQEQINKFGVNSYDEIKDIINYNWLED